MPLMVFPIGPNFWSDNQLVCLTCFLQIAKWFLMSSPIEPSMLGFKGYCKSASYSRKNQKGRGSPRQKPVKLSQFGLLSQRSVTSVVSSSTPLFWPPVSTNRCMSRVDLCDSPFHPLQLIVEHKTCKPPICPICQYPPSPTRTTSVTLKCGHAYCLACWERWGERRKV